VEEKIFIAKIVRELSPLPETRLIMQVKFMEHLDLKEPLRIALSVRSGLELRENWLNIQPECIIKV